MVNFIHLFLIIFTISPALGGVFIISSDNNDTTEHCIELNRHRVEFSKCCKYPQIHFKKFYDDSCVEECIGSRDHCCSFGCIYRTSNIINENHEVSAEGLKEVLRKSVKENPNWNDAIENSVDECMDEVTEVEKMAFCKFPWHILKIVGCTTRKLFLQCPKMKRIPECKISRQYAEDCL